MKKATPIVIIAGVLVTLAITIFLVLQRSPKVDPYQSSSGYLNVYNEEAEKRAKALSETGIVDAIVVADTGATQIINKKNPIRDISHDASIPVGELIEE